MKPISVITLLPLLISSASFCMATDQPQKKIPTVNKTSWQSISLSFRPVDITAQDRVMWACGVNETIASSSDAGVTWTIANTRRDGEVLLHIAFADAMNGQAAGTGGLLLTTVDGGKNWKPHHAPQTIRTFSFAGPLEGIAQIGSSVAITHDGGDNWQEVAPMKEDATVSPFSEILSVGALNSTHFAIALHQPQGENIFLSTVDAGKTWTPIHVENTFAGTLLVKQGEYWAYGIEYLGREHAPGGGYSAPVVLHSPDARTWTHGVRPTSEWEGCNAQGCYFPQGAIEIVDAKQEEIFSAPQDLRLTAHWAISGNTICMVHDGLKCGSLLASGAPEPYPETSGIVEIDRPGSHLSWTECIECPLGRIHPDPEIKGKSGIIQGVTIAFTENKDGTVKNVSLGGLPSEVMQKEIIGFVASWLLEPAHKGGLQAETERELKVDITCLSGAPQVQGLLLAGLQAILDPGELSCTVRPAAVH